MKNIATLTMNPCLDISSSVPAVIPTDKLRCREVLREPGGGGINVARAIHQLGGKAIAFYPAGGGTGLIVTEMLTKEGVATRPLPSGHLTRESFAVLDESSGEQYRFVLPGPKLGKAEWQRCMAEVTAKPGPDFLVVSGSLPPGVPAGFYAEIARQLQGSSTRLILDTSGKPFHQALKGGGIYLIKPNLRELEEYTGRTLDSEAKQEKVCNDLIDSGACEAVALSLGEEGALLIASGIRKRIAAIPVKVVSAVGAGDSFVAGMNIALWRGRGLEDAFLYGMAAATAALITPGTELCRLDDTEAYYQQLLRVTGG
ncbi:MAG: 1-phosphofructokinase family hexose kinase [Desulfurivibrionaceae bacterium]|nr:1-phosphofructokinase family hexose kinase [Desulfobulbales bacterium]MDT8334749.1 1-phosphofructokinase family hexose kinase [Desulfurivibrionaceae bacterium]